MKFFLLYSFSLSFSIYAQSTILNEKKNTINNEQEIVKDKYLKQGNIEKAKPSTFFEQYQRNYFVLGDPNAKFQLSFKWKILNLEKLYFGYTQLSFWSIFKKSGPFKDIIFSPELFYRFNINFLNYSNVDLGLYQHKSNGRS